MKILFISMHSIHASRWIDNVIDTEHQLFWYDVTGKGKFNELNDKVVQFDKLRKRKIPYLKGEYFLYKNIKPLYNIIEPLLKTTVSEELEYVIKTLKPDVIHSFEMQSVSYPILSVMKKYHNIPWIYSCWGSDIFYFSNFKDHKIKIANILKRINYLHTDCSRDYNLAIKFGFKGKFSGVIPGGGGYHIDNYLPFSKPVDQRNIILVKGYETKYGKAINVIKAIQNILPKLKEYKIVIFAAHKVVLDYVKNNDLNFEVYDRHGLKHIKLLELMGSSKIYIGNSISDGMPNTLLESMIMGAFPIQSNPGGVTQEIISHQVNGLLINNPNDISEISRNILLAINTENNFQNAHEINFNWASEKLDSNVVKNKILEFYNNIKMDIYESRN